uniref:Uncharacterized protein n=1 Tax=Manihot esculenta TaxID=3983 RepID=A0A2C9UIH3_MANES
MQVKNSMDGAQRWTSGPEPRPGTKDESPTPLKSLPLLTNALTEPSSKLIDKTSFTSAKNTSTATSSPRPTSMPMRNRGLDITPIKSFFI